MNTNFKKVNILSNRVANNIFLFASGQLVSLMGSSIFTFIISLYILELTGSAISFSISFAIGTLPRLIFGPFSGVVVDKFNKKKMIVSFDILSGLILIALFLFSYTQLTLTYIYIATFLLSTANTFFNTAIVSSIPSIVDDENIVKINSLSQCITSLSSICAPLLGGILFEVINIRLFILINAISFFLSAISEIFIKFNVEEKCSEKKNNIIEEFFVGLKYIYNKKWLFYLFIFVLLFNSMLVISFEITLPYLTKQVLQFSSIQIGGLNSIYTLGVFITSIILTINKGNKINYKKIIASILIMGIAISFIGIFTSGKIYTFNNIQYIFILCTLYIIIGIAETIVNIPILATIQKTTPNNLLGRVQGILTAFVLGLVPLSSILGGILIDKIVPWLIILICGIIICLLTFIMLNNEEIKKM